MVKEFNVNVKMEERWIPYFQSLLMTMQKMGRDGRSRLLGFYSDGDGDFRPTFEFDIPVSIVEGIEKQKLIEHHKDDWQQIQTSPLIIPSIMFDAG